MKELAKNISQIIMAIRSHTNRAFIGSLYYKGTITVVDGVFTMGFDDLLDGDIIEIFGSKFSDGIHMMKDSNSTYDTIRDESFKGYIVLIHPPLSTQALLTMSKYVDTLNNDPALRRKQIGDVSATMHAGTDLVQGFPSTLMSPLNMYRVLPGNIPREYANVGINVKRRHG